MFTLIKNGYLYAPEALGKKDILIAGNKIVAIGKDLSAPMLVECETIDANGKIVTPGLIDQHVHLTGGGGEGGLSTRTPSVKFSSLIQAGLTTVVGVLGTDGTTRSPRDLYAKAMGLRDEGITTFFHTGSYQVPTVTITGSIRDDLIFVNPVVGVKMAIADHRGSFPTTDELMRVISDVRMGGMLAGKKGILHMHMGDLPNPLEQVEEIIARGIPRHHFSPTHVARNKTLFADAINFAKAGAHIDITSGGSCAFGEPAEAVIAALESGVDPKHLTVSSDGNGSLPKFDEGGNMVAITAAPVNANAMLLPELIERGVSPEIALGMMTANVAKSVGIKKGEISVGSDADVCIFNEDYTLSSVIAMGKTLIHGGEQRVIGNFE